jgi:D-methionine transport system substrate-binding protein
VDAKIDAKSALFQDDPDSPDAEPYINIFAARAKDKDNATLIKVAKIWHDPEVTKSVVDESDSTAKIVTGKSQADLQAALDKLQSELQQQHK